MLEIKDIEKLAKLARIELTEEEKAKYLKDLGSILGYVDQIKEVIKSSGPSSYKVGELRNVMRPDEVKNESGSDTKAVVAEFPERDEDYLKVKKILEN